MKTWRWSVAAAAVVIMSACGSDSSAGSTPGDDSVEAGFARDMSVHHSQAVAMAEAIRNRTADPEMKILAADIALGQQAQIGRMSGWLDEWGLPIGSTNPPMAWMMPDMDMSGATMPGMATREQINALSTLPVDEAEISFLQLMIAHHAGGIEMAQAALARTEHPSVVRLATAIVESQQAEIRAMTDMLAKRGAKP